MNKKKNYISWSIIFLVPFLFFVFYLFWMNFSSDSIYLYNPQKIFLAYWLKKGIVPFYNPYLFAGTPFFFDPNMGNLHPFTLFFLLPYPLSFALWCGSSVFLFLSGFYLFFSRFCEKQIPVFLGILLVFFSGTGVLRLNNPAVFLVIAHFGFVLYSLSFLQKKSFNFWFLIACLLMTVSGHIQIVVYGYLLILIVGLIFYKIPFKRLFFNLLSISILCLPYVFLFLPMILRSTRMSTDISYLSVGTVSPQQYILLLFPYMFGILKDGSLWNAGVKYELLGSIILLPVCVLLAYLKKIPRVLYIVCFASLLISFGTIQIPFLRGASQIFVLFHVTVSLLFVQYFDTLLLFLQKLKNVKKIIGIFACLVTVGCVFCFSPLFASLFLKIYALKKNAVANLFFDKPTVTAIGALIGWSFIPWLFLSFGLYFFRRKKSQVIFFIVFIVFEGMLLNYFQNFFIPQSAITKKISFPVKIDLLNYRFQSTMDVIPYTGFHTYLGNVLQRPPFSKEISQIDEKEIKTYDHLAEIFQYLPSSWALMSNIKTVQ